MKDTLAAAVVLLIISSASSHNWSYPCQQRYYDQDSFVCVCREPGCNDVPPFPKDIEPQEVVTFTSSLKDQRFDTIFYSWKPVNGEKLFNNVDIRVDSTQKYQKILGFGGAFTDAMGVNWNSLSEPQQKALIDAYYGDGGAQYTMGRVPIASCDFSNRNYSYDDVAGDLNLKHFALAEEDLKYKIPMIKYAQSVSPLPIRLFGSPWSAPAWMKTNNDMTGSGWLLGKAGDDNHKAWANYFVKFLDAYAEHNITYWGLTVQNEPTTGFVPHYRWQTMAYTPTMMRDFIAKDLGPALNASVHHVKLMTNDDQRLFVEWNADIVLADPEAAKYIDGIAVHWYMDRLLPESLFHVLLDVHDKHPDRFLLNTEACIVLNKGDQPLGKWSQAEAYADSVIEDLNSWVSGWVDWNMALDERGGPNWVGNYVNAPIIVNATSDEFYKQPIYYALAHFSGFMAPDSIRVFSQAQDVIEQTQVKVLASVTPDEKHTVLVIMNKNNKVKKANIISQDRPGQRISLELQARSIKTVIWKNP